MITTPATSPAIAKKLVVGLRYLMRNRHNEVLEDRMSGSPAVYLQGGTSILPALQSQLEGLVAGDRKQVVLQMESHNDPPDYTFDVVILFVRAASEAELILGYPLPVAADCGPDCDCYSESPGGLE